MNKTDEANETNSATSMKQISKWVGPNEYSWRELIIGDAKAWYKIWHPAWRPDQPIKLKDTIHLYWNYVGLRAAFLYRLSHLLWLKGIPAIPGIIARLNISLHGFDIPAYVTIGPGLYIPHPVGTVITANRIGKNLSLISANTIGSRNEQTFPIIGDNVLIGAGARVLGGITIGDNVLIGANAVVIEDVPANYTAVGVPAKIIPRKTK